MIKMTPNRWQLHLFLSFLILQFMLLFQGIKQDDRVRISCYALPSSLGCKLDSDCMLHTKTRHHMAVFAKWQILVVDSSIISTQYDFILS